ncbi:hypothetical protein T484DRAFT_1826206, partial [Baffinella frigidus]
MDSSWVEHVLVGAGDATAASSGAIPVDGASRFTSPFLLDENLSAAAACDPGNCSERREEWVEREVLNAAYDAFDGMPGENEGFDFEPSQEETARNCPDSPDIPPVHLHPTCLQHMTTLDLDDYACESAAPTISWCGKTSSSVYPADGVRSSEALEHLLTTPLETFTPEQERPAASKRFRTECDRVGGPKRKSHPTHAHDPSPLLITAPSHDALLPSSRATTPTASSTRRKRACPSSRQASRAATSRRSSAPAPASAHAPAPAVTPDAALGRPASRGGAARSAGEVVERLAAANEAESPADRVTLEDKWKRHCEFLARSIGGYKNAKAKQDA